MLSTTRGGQVHRCCDEGEVTVVENILTLNTGSSSLKFAVFSSAGERVRGQVEGLCAKPKFMVREAGGRKYEAKTWSESSPPDTALNALNAVLHWLGQTLPETIIDGVGHRIVHGGPDRSQPVLLDDTILEELERFVPLTPLQQPYNLAGVRAVRELFGDVPQVGCFDTAFHRLHPWVNDVFGLPRELYDEGVRRYGFHGLSYESVTQTLRRVASLYASGRLVVAHLGNGASMCAIRDGRSVGSTMGFSALDGLPMGTRCGQLDPGVLLYLLEQKGLSVEELSDMLHKRSGLKGLSGVSHDMRELEASPRPEAAQAIDYFVFRIRRELGAMAAVLGGLDALVFTGGIGENSVRVRERVCQGFEWLGIELDQHRNRMQDQLISTDGARCRVFAIPTDEEAIIADHTRRLVAGVDTTEGVQPKPRSKGQAA